MAISERTVQNKRNSTGELTGKPGTVYDVNIKYKSNGEPKTHVKKGFPTKREAQQYEAAMKTKLANPTYVPPTAAQRKQTVREYMLEWLERHGASNLRPSTKASYYSHMKNHIFPCIGDVYLGQLTPAMLDDMYATMAGKGLSASSVRYAHRIMGVALEHARKYHYIESNPARDTITKFGKQGKTPDPYTIEEMQKLFSCANGTHWEMILILGGLYGLRLSEALGLRWRNVDLDKKTFSVIEQLPFQLPASVTEIQEMAPVKAGERTLPLTDTILPYFRCHKMQQEKQKQLLAASGERYYDNDLVLAKPNGLPERRDRVSASFGQFLRHQEMRHIRLHDLRHSAATNMHQQSGDFYTVGQILGHSSLKGVGIQLGISNNLESVTEQYIDVRMDRKLLLLENYHKAVLGG